jgi:hypothetical protein
MPVGANKIATMGAAGSCVTLLGEDNYYGDGSLGIVTFGATSALQQCGSVGLGTVLATGSTSGPGASSYGTDPCPRAGLDWDQGATQCVSASNVPNGASGCYEFNVANQVGLYDGDMAVANFAELSIDSNVTLTTERPCRGLLVYVAGNCTINGALSMTSRGAFADPTSASGAGAVSSTGIRLAVKKTGITDSLTSDFTGTGTASIAAVANQTSISGDGKIITVSRAGATGATGVSGGNTAGAQGTDGSIGQSGGGGGGSNGGNPSTNGNAASGTCFSGGSGGGAGYDNAGGAAVSNGGAGGTGGSGNSGGSGNPGGTGTTSGGNDYGFGNDGTGGLLYLIVAGDLTIGSGGTVEAEGQEGGEGSSTAGGSSGGGNVIVLYAGTLSNSGSITADGGEGGTAFNPHPNIQHPNRAGHGSTQIIQINL